MPRKARLVEPKVRRRKTAAADPLVEAPTPVAAFTAEEMKYVEKHPDQRFVARSLTPPGVETCFGRKRTITILCGKCDAPRVIATSDAHHCRYCVACKSEAKKAARKAKNSDVTPAG
ncbi:hypothetical protein [Limnoglobus roseus]|uniref:Uncharacterized protein n=1 Tax=Limnoglobus roseus TaxID=2598579 RepID=A0A5C1A6N7_9BACT|nr:hypothetical protein [Limnoglobus roseus]QEL13887.1 hypothetical protein PX52LOC_00745 [Limnoglobus roseus]